MKLWPVLLALVVGFVYLSFHYSFMLAFGTCYVAGLIIVGSLAMLSRRRPADWLWQQQAEKVNSSD